MSWICGWAFVVGNITITLAVNFGTTLFLAACINVFESEPGVGIFAAEPWQIYLIFFAITLLCNAVAALGNRWLPYLDTFAIFWTFAGLICIVVCVLAIAKNGRHDAAYVFGEFDPSNSGWPAGWSFCVGLLHAAYATSSTGMIISMCEEVQQPATQVPKAMVATIVLNTIAGLIFLIPLVFVMPDQAELAALVSAQPTPVIIKSAIGSSGGTIALLLPLLVLALFCGIGCTTASSRCTWAFARDGAIPGSKWWKQVNVKLDVPLNAMMMIMVVELVLGLIYFGSSAAFNAFSGVGVICLTLSYACPILVNLITGRKQVTAGNFYLGKLGWFCNVVAICWSALALPLFCMPTAIPVVPDYMNYASVVFFAFFVVATAWYFIWGKTNYRGPPTHEDAVLEARRASVISHQEKVQGCPVAVSSPPSPPYPEATAQFGNIVAAFTGSIDKNRSEDCLTLNIWSKDTPDKSNLVIVYFHGGRYSTSTSNTPFYNGQYLANSKDIIVVALNFRINVFGFSGAPITAQNVGLLDQRLAVQRIHNNIRARPGFSSPANPPAAWHSITGVSHTSMTQPTRCEDRPAAVIQPSALVSYFQPTPDGVTVFNDYKSRPAHLSEMTQPTLLGQTHNEAAYYKIPAFRQSTTLPASQWQDFSAASFTCPPAFAARARTSFDIPTWRFRYFGDWDNRQLYGPSAGNGNEEGSGAYHWADMEMVLGASEDVSGVVRSDEEVEMERVMMGAWGAFARNPGARIGGEGVEEV
ncbi:MAG: hypothetical protein L6R42_007337 [Xanthoria sp. 1 TBL-2021]|nr:MAG: hypothetical protein L6R42_007337 [Xanthoria sp. 1 TBL-2021]